jgi:hypothetical protein
MVAVPAVMPVATPIPELIPAMAVLLLSHVPNPVTSDNAVVVLLQITVTPVIGLGNGLTVMLVVAIQPAADL